MENRINSQLAAIVRQFLVSSAQTMRPRCQFGSEVCNDTVEKAVVANVVATGPGEMDIVSSFFPS